MPHNLRSKLMTMMAVKSPPRAQPSVDTYERPYFPDAEEVEARSVAEEITSWAILIGWAVASFVVFAIAIGIA
jgi:hypothetical protein